MQESALAELLSVERAAWEEEIVSQRKFFDQYGPRLPDEIRDEHEQLAQRLSRFTSPVVGGASRVP
jgi:GTP-dependent phosphoenolpyruvate carboxykinase